MSETKQHNPKVVKLWPTAGKMAGLGRAATYRAAEAGQIPTIRLGKRLLVPLDRWKLILAGKEPQS